MDASADDSMDVSLDATTTSVDTGETASDPSSSSTVKPPTRQPKCYEYKVPPRKAVRVFSEKRLKNFLLPVLNSLVRNEHSTAFLQPVDTVALGLSTYTEIIKHPMDLSTIRKKLKDHSYIEAWQFIDDVWLMLDNAKRFNRKGSNVYRGAEALGKFFEEIVDSVMTSMGYCCGKRLFYTPPTLFCLAKRVCIIPRDTTYYSYDEKHIYCKKCFQSVVDPVPLSNDASEESLLIPKSKFELVRNDHLEPEPYVPCTKCGRFIHQICALYLDAYWPNGFVCENCRKPEEVPSQPAINAASLPVTYLSDYMESRLNNYLKQTAQIGKDVKVTIRVVSIRDRIAMLKPQMAERHPEHQGFPYRSKAVFAFLSSTGHDVLFFGMHVQEYGSDSPDPNKRRVYIGYLDSVQYFRPRELRTSVYREIMLGYLSYIKKRGFLSVHIWACPPGNDDDYIFHCHPPEQKIPLPGRLQEWYKSILRKGQEEGIVVDFKNLFRYVTEANLNPIDELPYFEGDFWPMIIDDSLKEMDKEEEKKKEADSTILTDSSSSLKKKPKKTFKRLSHHQAKDLPTKVQNVIKRHQDSFLVVLINTPETLKNVEMEETEDADFLLYKDLMDGRDGLLSFSMSKHYEFSSYRRANFSTMLILFELAHLGDQNVFMCSSCNLHFTSGYRCKDCGPADLCDTCHELEKHTHKGDPIKTGKRQISGHEMDQIKMAYVDAVIHAFKCNDDGCKYRPCQEFKTIKRHTNSCNRGTNDKCEQCRPMLRILKNHARFCTKINCIVMYCARFKMEFRKERLQPRFLNNRCLQRRKRMMLQQKSDPGTEIETTSTNNNADDMDAPNTPMDVDLNTA